MSFFRGFNPFGSSQSQQQDEQEPLPEQNISSSQQAESQVQSLGSADSSSQPVDPLDQWLQDEEQEQRLPVLLRRPEGIDPAQRARSAFRVTRLFQQDPLEELLLILLTFHNQPSHDPLRPRNQLFGADVEEFFRNAFDPQYGSRGAPPASQSAVANLKTGPFQEADYLCVVCQDNIEVDSTATSMPCSHSFHPDCLKPWLEAHNSCPVCRYQLETDDQDFNRTISNPAPRVSTGTEAAPVEVKEQKEEKEHKEVKEHKSPESPGATVTITDIPESPVIDASSLPPPPPIPADSVRANADEAENDPLDELRELLILQRLLDERRRQEERRLQQLYMLLNLERQLRRLFPGDDEENELAGGFSYNRFHFHHHHHHDHDHEHGHSDHSEVKCSIPDVTNVPCEPSQQHSSCGLECGHSFHQECLSGHNSAMGVSDGNVRRFCPVCCAFQDVTTINGQEVESIE